MSDDDNEQRMNWMIMPAQRDDTFFNSQHKYGQPCRKNAVTLGTSIQIKSPTITGIDDEEVYEFSIQPEKKKIKKLVLDRTSLYQIKRCRKINVNWIFIYRWIFNT